MQVPASPPLLPPSSPLLPLELELPLLLLLMLPSAPPLLLLLELPLELLLPVPPPLLELHATADMPPATIVSADPKTKVNLPIRIAASFFVLLVLL